MSTLDELEQQAAEYVLGTLDSAERQKVSEARATNAQLDLLITQWEKRLDPMLSMVGERAPRADLFAEIEAKLPKQTTTDSNVVELDSLRKKINRWRNAAVVSTSIAAGLALFVILREPPPSLNQSYVAVFQQDDQQPAFLMSVDLATNQLTVRPITATGVPDKNYQLWIVSEQIGPNPQSLGLLPTIAEPTLKQVQYSPDILRTATFGISVEPVGGSPTGLPTGPAIHGQLYPTHD